MIESNSVEVGSGDLLPRTATGSSLTTAIDFFPFAAAIEHTRAIGVALIVSVAVLSRVFGLGASGFSEDEINKLRAAESYDRLDFTANAEHPMLMKLAVWGSLTTARWWNAHPALAQVVTISPEAALRLPNALAGAATTGLVFLLAEALFDTVVGAFAGLFWALDANATAINRIGKEDTFLLFFLLLAAYLYERAKAVADTSPRDRDRWYVGSGAAFGLMIASKYMPHYFGLHTLFNVAADHNKTDDDTPDKRWSFYAAMGLVFLAANFAVMLPNTWRYVASYAHGDTMRHSGYDFAHRIYVNTIGVTPWGLPPTFYLAFLATKVPLCVLTAAAVGIWWAFRRPSHRGATFIRVFLVFTLLPYSLVASKFLRYMLPVLVVVDMAAAVGLVWLMRRLNEWRSGLRMQVLAAVVVAGVMLPPLVQQISNAPFYGLAQNVIAAHLFPRGWLFPDDELYDAGVREAVGAIAHVAAPHAVVCSDATAVVAEYLARNGRRDLRSCSIAHDGLPMQPVQTWVIVQDGHVYFENVGVIDELRATTRPWLDVRVGGVSGAEVFLVKRAGLGPHEP